MGRQTYRQPDGQKDKQTDEWSDWQTDKQTDEWSDWQTDKQTQWQSSIIHIELKSKYVAPSNLFVFIHSQRVVEDGQF